jgi:hypothetical protein
MICEWIMAPQLLSCLFPKYHNFHHVYWSAGRSGPPRLNRLAPHCSLFKELLRYFNRCVRAMTMPQRTSLFNTTSHPTPFVDGQAPCSRADVRRPRPHEPRPGHLLSQSAMGRAREGRQRLLLAQYLHVDRAARTVRVRGPAARLASGPAARWPMMAQDDVRRMDWSRLPRKFLPSWIDAPRSRGRANS